MTRRDLLLGTGAILVKLALAEPPKKSLRAAVITDLHHGLAPDAMPRLQAFAEAVQKRNDLDLVMQMGDFCYSQPDSAPCASLFKQLPHRKIHVLGNHDMDKCDKTFAMKYFGMPSRYGVHEFDSFKFVVLDVNHFKRDGKIIDYANGNYFGDNITTFNVADAEQLDWLARELRKGKKPVILISHQPLGFAEPGQPMPVEQVEVLKVVTDAAKENPRGAVAMCMFGHLHVDRLEHHQGIPCYCHNSASYFWGGGMYPYTNPLFSFIELTTDGHMAIHGATGAFVKPPPASSDNVIGRSASIADRSIAFA